MSDNRLAILIDAENVMASLADDIFKLAGELGDPVVREIYGTAAALTAWVAPVLKYAIHPNLTIKAAKGKNSSDIALVIGAMDQLIRGDIDAFVIASSDSDFSSLSVRLRNAGKEVIGMGADKSNDLWRTACSRFITLGQRAQPQAPAPANRQSRQAAKPAAKPAPKPAPKPAASEPAERAAVIEQAIRKRLAGNTERMQVSTLFPMLNHMREYRADRQEQGMKPLHYLTSRFGGAFVFETTADGKTWISLPGGRPDGAAPEAEASETAPAEALPEAPAAEAEALAAPEPPEAVAEEAAETAPDVRAQLVEAGIPEDDVDGVIGILSDSAGTRAAYNRLRSAFGNANGRAYYQIVKKLAEAQ